MLTVSNEQVSKDFVFHFEGVNALFSKLRRAVEMISSLNSADLEPGGAAGGVVPLVTLDKAKDGKQKQVQKLSRPPWPDAISKNLPIFQEKSPEKPQPKKKKKRYGHFA